MLLQAGPEIQFAGEYNFLADPTAGAVGTINLSVHFPKFCWLTGFWVAELSATAGGAGATISFGTITTDVSPAVSTVNNLMTAQVVANFVAQPLRGVDLDAAPLRLLNNCDLTMSIAVNALTSGRLLIGGTYLQFVK